MNGEKEKEWQFEIRKAELADYEAVALLENLDFEHHRKARPDYFRPDSEGYQFWEYEELLSYPEPIAWVAVVGQEIAGLCFGRIGATLGNDLMKSRRVAYVEDLATAPQYRERGIASALMAKARAQAIEQKADALELCVWEFNQDAKRFYEHLGMKVQYYRMEERLKE